MAGDTTKQGGIGGSVSVSSLAKIVDAELGGDGGASIRTNISITGLVAIPYKNRSIVGESSGMSGPGGSGVSATGPFYGDASHNAIGATGGTENENASGFGAGGASVSGADTEQAGTSGFCRVWVT